MRLSKIWRFILSVSLVAGVVSACGTTSAVDTTTDPGASSEIVCITMPGNTASSDYPARQEEFEKLTGHQFAYTLWSYDSDFFRAQFETSELPTMYPMGSTSMQKMIQNGYCRDITEQVQARGWDEKMLSVLKDVASDGNGRIYGVPSSANALGLICNVAVFRAAGLVDENDVPVYPKTWEELVETCKRITEKTGAAGIALTASSNTGSLYWTNVAWNYGADLCISNDDGTFTAQLNTPEAVAAMNIYKELSNAGVVYGDPCLDDAQAACDAVGAGLAAMAFGSTDTVARLGLAVNDVAVVPLPAGPGGNFLLVTGSFWCFSPEATDAEVDAALDYIELYSTSPAWSDTREAAARQEAALKVKNGSIYLPALPCYTGSCQDEIAKITEEYCNCDQSKFEDFYAAIVDASRLRGEEEGERQQMYYWIASVIQEIFVNPDADIQSLMNTIDDYYQTVLDSYAILNES